MLYVSCTHDLYDGDVVAGKWYSVTEYTKDYFKFVDEADVELYCVKRHCLHLYDVSGAEWRFKYED